MGLILNVQNVPISKPEVDNPQTLFQVQSEESPSIWSQIGDFCQQSGELIQENAFSDVDKQAWKDYQEALEQAKKEVVGDISSPLEDLHPADTHSECPKVPETEEITSDPEAPEAPTDTPSECPEVPEAEDPNGKNDIKDYPNFEESDTPSLITSDPEAPEAPTDTPCDPDPDDPEQASEDFPSPSDDGTGSN